MSKIPGLPRGVVVRVDDIEGYGHTYSMTIALESSIRLTVQDEKDTWPFERVMDYLLKSLQRSAGALVEWKEFNT